MKAHHKIITKKLSAKLLVFLLLGAIVGTIVWWRQDEANGYSRANNKAVTSNMPQPTETVMDSPPQPTAPKPLADQTKPTPRQYSINDPTSIWVVVNKGRVLPADYAPANLAGSVNLRSDSALALADLMGGAAKDGLQLILVSGYRTYASQQSVYSGYVATQGQAAAERFSARPGHSEHQTGLAADVGASSGKCQLDKCFGATAEGEWLAANAHKYGFIIRYPKDQQAVTGYDYEPWHIRYIGTELAAELNKTGQTLEQFFNLPFYADYPTTSYELKTGS